MRLPQPIWTRFLPTPTVLAAATLGPLGRLPASGTWGSVAGLLYFVVILYPFGDGALLAASAIGTGLAIAICGEAEFRIGRKDPREVILDEFVAMPLCFVGWRALSVGTPRWAVLAAGFGLFRLFDIAKPFGIRRLQVLPGGWGIALDDTAAAVAACAVMHAGQALWARFG
jgi:phosphatidylglycerophosphatase A